MLEPTSVTIEFHGPGLSAELFGSDRGWLLSLSFERARWSTAELELVALLVPRDERGLARGPPAVLFRRRLRPSVGPQPGWFEAYCWLPERVASVARDCYFQVTPIATHVSGVNP